MRNEKYDELNNLKEKSTLTSRGKETKHTPEIYRSDQTRLFQLIRINIFFLSHAYGNFVAEITSLIAPARPVTAMQVPFIQPNSVGVSFYQAFNPRASHLIGIGTLFCGARKELLSKPRFSLQNPCKHLFFSQKPRRVSFRSEVLPSF